MNEMRDARLKKALDSAPDGEARPADAVREAILNKARLSAARAAPKPGHLASWWNFSRPWNSGLATVGLVAFVGVLIWSQDLLTQAQAPQGQQAPQADVAVQAPAPVVAASTVQAPSPQVADLAQPVPPKKARPVPAHKAEALVRDQAVAMEAERAAVTASRRQEAQENKAMAAAPPAPVPAAVPPTPAQVAEPEAHAASAGRIEMRVSAVAASTWTTLRILTPKGPVLLARELLSPATQLLIQQQLSAPIPLARSSLGADLGGQGLRVELLVGERRVGQLDLDAGELRRQLEEALAEARLHYGSRP